MVNQTCAFSQSELGKYFEWIVMIINACLQNKFRQFALKGLSNILQNSKMENKACCTILRATCRKHETPQLWMEGEGCGLFCSEVPLFESNVSTILSLMTSIYDYTGVKKVLFISPWQVDFPAGQPTYY